MSTKKGAIGSIGDLTKALEKLNEALTGIGPTTPLLDNLEVKSAWKRTATGIHGNDKRYQSWAWESEDIDKEPPPGFIWDGPAFLVVAVMEDGIER